MISDERIDALIDKYDRDIGIIQLCRQIACESAEAMRERCAVECEQLFKNAPNEHPEYKQNTISHGCAECAQAIRNLPLEPRA